MSQGQGPHPAFRLLDCESLALALVFSDYRTSVSRLDVARLGERHLFAANDGVPFVREGGAGSQKETPGGRTDRFPRGARQSRTLL